MKHIKSLLLIFAIIFCTIFCSCTDTSGTGNNGGNNNQNNNTQPIYQLQTPSNARIVEYEDGDVLFFDYDINAYEFRITFFKDGTFFKRLNPNPTLSQVMLGVYLEGFEPGEYTVKIIAKANPESTDLDSVESEGMSFIIKDKTDQGGNDDPVAEKYTVSFDTNGGSSISSQQVVKGSYATKPSNPAKTGYNFVEWQLNGKTFSFTTPITSNITLKAIWEVVGGTLPDTGLTDLSAYYSRAEGLVGSNLKTKLRTIVNENTDDTTYGELRQYLQQTDVDPKNSNNIILFYGHVSVKGTWDGGDTWNREHVWPKSQSWYPSVDNGNRGAGADIHHIRPESNSVNSSRGNLKMGEVTGGSVVKYSDGTIAGYRSSSYFEPNDCSKGDVARIYFYMLVRYSETDSSYPITKTAQSLAMLLEWHLSDPVDDLERVRNERAYQYQGNRNPFIDYPEFAELIWG